MIFLLGAGIRPASLLSKQKAAAAIQLRASSEFPGDNSCNGWNQNGKGPTRTAFSCCLDRVFRDLKYVAAQGIYMVDAVSKQLLEAIESNVMNTLETVGKGRQQNPLCIEER